MKTSLDYLPEGKQAHILKIMEIIREFDFFKLKCLQTTYSPISPVKLSVEVTPKSKSWSLLSAKLSSNISCFLVNICLCSVGC